MSRFVCVREFGALYRHGTALPRPRRPWLIDISALKPLDEIVPGDIADFSEAPDWSHWQLGDTSGNDATRLRWIEIEEGGRRLLICDRVLLVRVSWQDLADQGLVDGAPVTIDGSSYLCRLMTGGSDFRTGDDGYSGGSPIDNEWDRYVTNEAEVAGLPMPSMRDRGPVLNHEILADTHNDFWHWLGAVTWTATRFERRPTARCCRGYAAAQYFYLNTFDHRHEDIGWRPVLEPIVP